MTAARRRDTPRTAARIARVALVGALAVLAACGGSGAKGDGASSVTITGADGTAITLADLKGTPVVVNMWATWCTPCLKEMPDFDTVARELDGVRVIGVNVADTPEAAAKYAADRGVTYPQYTDPDGALSTAFAVTGLPATAFIDASGAVVEVHQGALTAAELRSTISSHFPTGGTTP